MNNVSIGEYNTLVNKYNEVYKENKVLRDNAEHNEKVVDKINWENMLLKKENQQLKEKLDCDLQWAFKYEKQVDNWNELKEFIVNEYYMYLPLEASTKSITILIDKMHELEQGSDSDE